MTHRLGRTRGCAVFLAASLTAVATVGGCTGSSKHPSASGQPPSSGTASAAGKIAPCSLLTQTQVGALLKTPVKPGQEVDQSNGPLTIRTCRWVQAAKVTLTQLSVPITLGIIQQSDMRTSTPAQYFEQTRSALHGATPVPNLGDQAFAGTNAVYVLKGNTELSVVVGTTTAPAQIAEAGAREALARL